MKARARTLDARVAKVILAGIAAGALWLGGNGVKTLAQGLGFLKDERYADGGQSVVVLLGALQVGGSLLALFGAYKAWRALFAPRPVKPAIDPIRERALANLAAARKVGDA
jgi:hypothetical protein